MAHEYAGRLRRQALLPRLATAVIGIPLLLGALWLGGSWWLVLLAVVLVLAAMEYAPLMGLTQRGELTLRIAGLFAFAVAATGPDPVAGWIIAVWAALLIVLGLIPFLRAGVGVPSAVPSPAASSPAASVLLGVAYLAVPFAILVRWRLELTPHSVLVFLVIIWASDIAAYFVGLAIGRHKLAPRVSPGKSWEGAAGGLAGGLAAGLLLAPWAGLSRGDGALWAAALTFVSQAGDLFESALKRRAGVKDSGRLLPGHGGVLDRFDGVLIAAPVGYALLRLLAAR